MQRRKRDFVNRTFLSVVVPAYKQEKTIVKDIRKIEDVLRELHYNYEIILVDDGSKDNTYKRALKITSSKVKIFRYEKNEGKGHAIRYGMLQAKGDIIGFIDSGMDINPNGFAMLLNHMEWYDADIIIGSKRHPASKVKYPWRRRVLSIGYQLLVRVLFGFKVRDTQVGLKFFKRPVLEKILPRLLVKAWAFDVEMLAVAYALGYKRIYEAPIELDMKFKGFSMASKGFWDSVIHSLWDTFAVFYRLKILHYYTNKANRSINMSLSKA